MTARPILYGISACCALVAGTEIARFLGFDVGQAMNLIMGVMNGFFALLNLHIANRQ